MKILLLSFLMLFSVASHSADINYVPFASDLKNEVRHYNRAAPNLATAGTISEEAFAEIASFGVKNFIDLRTQSSTTSKAKALVEAAGGNYYNIPVFSSEGISKEQVSKFAQIYEKIDGNIIIHCRSGNRVGALWTAYLLSNDISKEEALKQGRTAGLKKSLELDVLKKFGNL